MQQLRRLWRWVWEALAGRGARYRTVRVADLPERLRVRQAYLIGENGQFWSVALLCPCGCRETIQLNLVPDTRPVWQYAVDKEGELTLSPSVWRTAGCRSHFYLQGGLVRWCGEQARATSTG